MKNINEAFSSEESKEIYDKFITIVNTRRDNLVKKYGKEAERVAYASAVNQVKKKAANKIEEPTTKEPMDQEQKLKEMIQAALSKPLSEKKKSFPDLTGDGKVTKADILKGRGVIDEASNNEITLSNEILDFLEERGIIDPSDAQKVHKDLTTFLKSKMIKQDNLEEDLDLGHTDNEPHMIKADLYRIGKYAMELYKMVDQFEGEQEVDFPHWWQSKIVKAKSMIASAKHYLEFELNEPQVDAMVDVAAQEDIIDESPNTPKHIIVRQWVGPNSDFYLANKKEEYWDDKDYDVFNRLWKMVGDEGKIPSNLEEKMSKKQVKKRGKIYDALKDQGMSDEKAGRIATAKAQKIKEAVLAKIKNK
jgi:hypothetical protein